MIAARKGLYKKLVIILLILFSYGTSRHVIIITRSDADPWTASIGMADPDPSAKELPKHRKSTVSAEGTVEFRCGIHQ